MRISLCMIVKDEEKYIKQCLDSAQTIADEIIIVDTGSVDRTRELIQNGFQNKVKLAEIIWNQDFSEARNVSLSHASGNWILIMDADEKIDCDITKLREFLKGTHDTAFRIPIYNMLSSGMVEVSTGMVRLFKNDGSRYTGAIHEQLKFAASDVKIETIEESLCKILHYGYLKSSYDEKNKVKRNLDIIKAEMEKDPKNPFHRYNLGVMKMIEGKYEEALDEFAASHRLCQGVRAPFTNNMVLRMAQCLWASEQYELCSSFVSQLLQDVQLCKIPDLYYYRGYCLKETGHYKEAANNFEKCLELGEVNTGISLQGMGTYIPLIEWARVLVLQNKIQDAVMKYMEAIFSRCNYRKTGLQELIELLQKHGMVDVLNELKVVTGIK